MNSENPNKNKGSFEKWLFIFDDPEITLIKKQQQQYGGSMSAYEFTQDQLDLHAAVREAYQNPNREALKQKHQERTQERTIRRAYSPQNDIQLLQVLLDNHTIDKFALLKTDQRKVLCEEICNTLKVRFGEERTIDSVHYRITQKLLKANSLADINYRSESKPKKPSLKAKAKVTEAKQEETEDESNNDFDNDDDGFLDD